VLAFLGLFLVFTCGGAGVLCDAKLEAGTKSSLFVAGCGVWNWDLAKSLCEAKAPTRRAVTFSASPEKVTKKGRLLLERSKSFLCRATAVLQCSPYPHNDKCGAASERLRTAARRVEACAGLKT
jgi:hypothetical protein